ncbi:xylanase/chitin deacetylase [Candidatus Scalindua japonica]|uniref:Xylanase/chitin deacetylase n=1 Tax=Candidatus Scalindua japonica TaxID=1284222 RepID=A0A286TWU0_9BACT|nr:polysaccharide deacetylase family protein [Candidatus Scalindua japonica]GAX60357.1 xylanase/chitin deacetylase [Candidatus Scalindua japonica]
MQNLRKFKVATKLFLDRFRPYPYIMGLMPRPGYIARTLGSVIHESAVVKGKLNLSEPAWFQMNSGAFIENLTISGMHFCYIGENCSIHDRHIDQNTFVLNNQIIQGVDNCVKELTVSVDLEGAYSLAEGSTGNHQLIQKESADRARQIHSIFKESGIKSTWFVVGDLFEDRYMGPVCDEIMADPDIEIGWHTQNHINYFSVSEHEVDRDLECAARVRLRHSLELKSMAFPYNAVGFVDKVVSAGFSRIRGYVGQFYIPATVDFGNFVFMGTSMFVGPDTVENCLNKIPQKPANFNIFLHPVDWIGHDISPLRHFMRNVQKPEKVMEKYHC